MEGQQIRTHTRSSDWRWRFIGNSGMVSWKRFTKRRWPSSWDPSGIPFQREVELPVVYKGQKLSTFYKADFLCFESVIVELKALGELSLSPMRPRILNYLKATGLSVGLLFSFGLPSPGIPAIDLLFSSAPLCVICRQFSFCLRIDHGPQEERPDACAPGAS